MIKIENFIFSDFQVNTYVLYDDSREAVIIDPGCHTPPELESLQDFIQKHQLKPVKILFTHCHPDHAFGAKALKKAFPDLSLEAHAQEKPILEMSVELARMFLVEMAPPPPLTRFIEEGEEITWGNSRLKALLVPGHSPGSLSFYNAEQSFVLTGDALFAGSIGRTDLPGGSMELLLSRIKSQLLTLPEDCRVYSGHGPDTTISAEMRQNPYLQG